MTSSALDGKALEGARGPDKAVWSPGEAVSQT